MSDELTRQQYCLIIEELPVEYTDGVGENIDELLKHEAALRSQRDALAEALRDMFVMMEEGLLIRDISKDGDSDWGMRMLQFTRRLAAANSALAAAPEAGKP